MVSVALVLALLPAFQSEKDSEYDLLILSARRKGDEKNWKGAEEDLTRAIKLNPAKTEAYEWRAVVRISAGWKEKALEDFDVLIRLNDRDVRAYRTRGKLFAQLSRFREANDDLTQALKLGPVTAELLEERGEVRLELGDHAGALQDTSQAIDIDPRYAFAWNCRGIAKIREGDFDGADTDLTEALKLSSQKEVVLENLSHLRHLQGRLPEARAAADEAARLWPKSTMAVSRGAAARFGARDWAGALAGFRRRLESGGDPSKFSRFYIWLARCRLGEEKQASEELRASLKDGKPPEDWPGAIAAYHLREISEPDLFKAAQKGEPQVQARQKMAAHFHAGFRRAVAGDTAGAREHYLKCVETKLFQFTELAWAQDELRFFDAAKK